MPSDAKKREQQRKKEAAKARQTGKKTDKPKGDELNKQNGTIGELNGQENGSTELSAEEALCAKLEADARLNAEARACTGSLAVHPKSRDVKIANFSITFHGSEMLQDTMLELNCGRRYGLIGLNGSGKSTLLAVLGNRRDRDTRTNMGEVKAEVSRATGISVASITRIVREANEVG
ncbi:unnamed protein product, partial [Callosobruchus maculatus]